ncbi:hypothetical protein E2C01_011454 [Portunus trituberculatus]|uniref:Uncharacterized protein n=1 Tax=Portunus trituberculatus TaxID=210409 RepID=A0A5B7DBR9_PORTR|nr:hypothetical protein [Portunus trituberculatus]
MFLGEKSVTEICSRALDIITNKMGISSLAVLGRREVLTTKPMDKVQQALRKKALVEYTFGNFRSSDDLLQYHDIDACHKLLALAQHA